MWLSVLLLVTQVAVAEDTNPAVTALPVGTTITVPGAAPVTLTQKDWLLTDSAYRSAVTQAKQLEIIQPAYEECTDTTLKLTHKIQETSQVCLGQFSLDENQVSDLTAQLQTMESRAMTAESRLKDVRQQRTIAWAITSGLVLGAAAVTVVAINP